MAQLKDLIVTGATRLIGNAYAGTIQITTLNAPTAAGGTTYGPGTNGYVLKSNGSSVYWGSDNNSVTGVKGNAESSYRTGQVNLTPANIGALPLAGGKMTGAISWASGSISEFSSAPTYLLGIEAFANGGATKWRKASETNVGTATTATKLSNTSKIGDTNIPVYFTANGVPAALTDYVHVSTYSLPAAKGVRITYPSYAPVLISVQRANSGGRLVLIGGGYGAEGTARNDFTELVSCAESSFTWSLPHSTSISCAVEIMNHQTSGSATVVVWSKAAATFTEITALTTAKQNKVLLNSSNYTSYTVTKTGTGASGSWGISITGSSASCTGNAATATKLATARTISLTGSVTGSGSFDGSGNLSIATTTNHHHNTLTVGNKTYNGSSDVTIEIADLGLASTTTFIGLTSTNLSNGSTTNPVTITIGPTTGSVTATNGNVVMEADSGEEYIWSGNKWNLMGLASSWALANHIHGNITNAGTITSDTAKASGQHLVITDSNNKICRSAITLGTATNTYLRNDGSWATPPDTNKYHKTGSWSGLTYTATAVNSADELKFTVPSASTSAAGAVQLSSATNSTSTTLAATASAVKAAYDLANGKVNRSGDTMTGDLEISGAYLKVTNNSNTVTIGSQNNSWMHIYNSANIPFIFNNTVATTSGNLGTSSYRWGKLYIGTADSYGGTAKPIYWDAGVPTAITETIGDTTTPAYVNAGTLTAGYPYLRYINTNDTTTWTADSLSQTDSIAFTRADITGAYTTGHIVWLNARTIGTPFQLVVHDSSDLYLYKRWYSSDTWSEWTKMNAGYADSAGSATKATQDQNGLNIASGYLKLSGGTMTGAILGSNTNLGSTTAEQHFGQLYLGRVTADSRALDSANPLIEFSNGSRGQYAQIIYTDYNNQGGSDSFTFVSNQSDLRVYAPKVYGAVWNDYAEYRETKEEIEPGRCICEVGDDTLELTTERLQKGCEIVSDTFGFAIGESETAKTPTAASGRVLAYLYEDREIARQHIGDSVCSGPNGTVSIMTEEEEMRYPSRIIGTISAVPDYEIWHAGADGKLEIKVNGRIWIRIR